mmetsp:Transcript_14199/g.40247  ORF Transcript_14199/g.40247 Transcript_14199/m.40247 type:complete len:94 (-) Transcript_14199:50-331(-)
MPATILVLNPLFPPLAVLMPLQLLPVAVCILHWHFLSWMLHFLWILSSDVRSPPAFHMSIPSGCLSVPYLEQGTSQHCLRGKTNAHSSPLGYS